MSNIKISELSEANDVNEEDLLMIIQNGQNKKIKASKIGTGQSVGGDTLPIGSILPYSSDSIPDGWLLCDGSLISRTDYDELFNIIGTTYGSGDGSTTFALPNLKGKVTVGKNSNDEDFNALGNTGGEKDHTLTINEMPSHSHHVTSIGIGSGSYGYNISSLSIGSEQNEHTAKTGGGQSHNNLQPYLVTNYIIKTKMTASLIGQVIDSLEDNSTTDSPSVRAVKELIPIDISDQYTINYTNKYFKALYYPLSKKIEMFFQIEDIPTGDWQILATPNNDKYKNVEYHYGAGYGSGAVFAPIGITSTGDLQVYTISGINMASGHISFLLKA